MIEIKEVIEDYNIYVKKIPVGALYIADNLREDNLTEALQAIKNFSEGVLWISRVNKVLVENGFDISMDIAQIEEFLLEINEGLEKQDFVLVADMFEYEIAPFFEEAEELEGPQN